MYKLYFFKSYSSSFVFGKLSVFDQIFQFFIFFYVLKIQIILLIKIKTQQILAKSFDKCLFICFFSSHMRTMRQMSTMMNSLFSDPFGMFSDFDNHHRRHAAITSGHHHSSPVNSLMSFGGFPMMNLGGLLSGSLDSSLSGGGSSLGYSSSTVVSMTTGPDGRPQVYKVGRKRKLVVLFLVFFFVKKNL